MNTQLAIQKVTPIPRARFGPTRFADIIRRALDTMRRSRWNQMVWCDADYLDWPLGSGWSSTA